MRHGRPLHEAQEAIEAALKQEPIGRLDEILNHPDRFKLDGADEKLVVVLVGEPNLEERGVVSLGLLRASLRKREQAKQHPVPFG
jgi:hypothetical protein